MQLKVLLAWLMLMVVGASAAAVTPQYSSDAQNNAAQRRAKVATPVEGRHYKIVNPVGKAEQPVVVEFFSYHCPHCRGLEPFLTTWKQEKPTNIHFQRMHAVGMFGEQADLFARAYYTAEVLGIVEKVHQPFFDLIQLDRKPPRNEHEVAAFFGKFGVKEDTVISTMKSFPVETKMNLAKQAAQNYRLRSVPTFVLNDKFLTDGSLAQSSEMLDKVLSELPLR